MTPKIEKKIKEIEKLKEEIKIKSILTVEKLLEIENNILFYRSLKGRYMKISEEAKKKCNNLWFLK